MDINIRPDTKVLIVEDDDGRIGLFQKALSLCQVVVVTKSVDVAIAHLQMITFDYIFLDHDLAESHYENENTDQIGTGDDVAKWLAEYPEVQNHAQIIIHSLNRSGSLRMLQRLHDAGFPAVWFPFAWSKM